MRISMLICVALGLLVGSGALAEPPPPSEGPIPRSVRNAELTEIRSFQKATVTSAYLDNNIRILHRSMPEAGSSVTICCTVYRRQNNGDAARDMPVAGAAAYAICRPPGSTGNPASVHAFLDERAIKVNAWSEPATVSIMIDSPVESFDEALLVLRLMLVDPAADEEVISAWRRGDGRLEIKGRRPGPDISVVLRAIAAAAVPVAAEDRRVNDDEAATVKTPAVQMFLEELCRTGPIEIGIVGNITMNAAMTGACDALGDAPLRDRADDRVWSCQRTVGREQGALISEREGGEPVASPDAMAYLGVGFIGPDIGKTREYRALIIGITAIGDRAQKNTRDAGVEDLRFDAFGYPSQTWSKYGIFGLAARVGPTGVANATNFLESEITNAVVNPLTDDEIASARDQVLPQINRLITSPEYWAHMLSHASYTLFDPDAVAAARPEYESIRKDEVMRLLKLYAADSGEKGRIRVVAMPR